jgi:hypothetical protein
VSYTSTFGRLTAAGAGGWKAGSSASTVLTGADANHFAMSPDGVLTPTAAFAADPRPSYTLGATIAGAAATIAITTIADAYTVADDGEADALDWAAIAAAGSSRTVLFRGPARGGPAFYSYSRPAASSAYFSAPWFNLRSFAHGVVCRSADSADQAKVRLTSSAGGVQYHSYLVQTGGIALEDLDLEAPWTDGCTHYNTANQISAYTFVDGEAQQRIGALDIRNTLGDFRIEGCKLRANLRDFPLSGPRKLVWYGLIGDDATGKIAGSFVLRDNDVYGARRLIELPDCTTGTITVEGNSFHDFGVDCLVIGGRASGAIIRWNHFFSPWNNPASDTGHADFLQFVYSGTTNIIAVLIYGNIFCSYRYDGVAVKHDTQVIFCDDIGDPGAPAYYDGFLIYGNLGLTESGHGITVKPGRNCHVYRNTMAKDVLADPYYGTPRIGELQNGDVGSEPSNNHFAKNIASLLQLRAGSGSTSTGNIETSADPSVYAALFVGPTFRPTSKAQLLALFAPKPGGQAAVEGLGAIGAWIDFAARTVDLTGAPWLQ